MDRDRNGEGHERERTRTFNEWVDGANESMGAHAGTDPFRCECGDGGCTEAIELTPAEYDAIRAYGTRFAVAHNHEHPGDTIVDEYDRYTVVERPRSGEPAMSETL